MFTIDGILALALFIAFATEFVLALIANSPQKEKIADMKTNFFIGICLVSLGILVKGVEVSIFSLLYSISIFKPDEDWFLWLVAFIGCDFIHYLYHLLGHKTRLFWAAHVTHHSSEHYNLSTGWRINFIQLFYRSLFWAPLCYLGIPPYMVLLVESLISTHNFLIHTERIKKIKYLDWWFNTPSNHRVHHASNPEYLDKNLGGILMVFDHLFGTYAREETVPVYGITKNIHSNKPSRIYFHEYCNIQKEWKVIKKLRDKFEYLFSPPK